MTAAITLVTRSIALTALVLVGVVVHTVTPLVSPDTIGMGIGVIFGGMVGIATGLLIAAKASRTPTEPPTTEPLRFEVINTDTGQIAPYIMRQLPGLAQIELDENFRWDNER